MKGDTVAILDSPEVMANLIRRRLRKRLPRH